MKTKKFNVLHLILMGTGLIIVGIVILNTGILALQAFTYLLGIVFIVLGLSQFIKIAINKLNGTKADASSRRGFINLVIGALTLTYPGIPITLFGLLTAIYFLLMASMYWVAAYTKKKNKVKHRLNDIILCIFFSAFGFFMLFSQNIGLPTIMNAVSIYFILYGTTYYKDALKYLIPEQHKNKLKRKIRFAMPVFASSMIPRLVLQEVNNALLTNTDNKPGTLEYISTKTENQPDIEVLIHVTSKGAGIMGHVDLIMDGIAMSYGNYDSSSARMGELIGDGVLFFTRAESYIPFVIKDSGKTLFAFGLKLDPEQKQAVKERIDEIREQLYCWTPPKYSDDDPPYAARLEHAVKTNFYKFNKGAFKTYFVGGTNCVKLADSVIGRTGIDVLNFNGIITPGAYYDYLDNEFARPNSFVVSKKIYN